MNWQAILRLFPRYRWLERELETLRDGEKTARALYKAEKERTERLEAENLHHMKLVTDWTCMMNGWAPIYGVAPVPAEPAESPMVQNLNSPRRRQARDVAFESDQEFDREWKELLKRRSEQQ